MSHSAASGEAIIIKWFSKFRTGYMSTEGNERSRCQKGAVTEKDIKNSQKDFGWL